MFDPGRHPQTQDVAVSEQAMSPMIPRSSRFWGLVRWTYGAALVFAVLFGAVRQKEATFGYLGALTGMALLEIRFLREERHPFLSWSSKRVTASLLLLGAISLVVVIRLITG